MRSLHKRPPRQLLSSPRYGSPFTKPASEDNVTNEPPVDRPLVHVNKKGRPVSQCQHCRGLRKARSQHVHCECQQKGHSKEDCQHEKGDGKQGKTATIPVRAPLTELEPGTCCCQHTGKCTCALKKDHLEAVPEDVTHMLQARESPKPRHLNMNSHESKATVFTNGHHKPVHKFNDAHNQLGAPYKIPSRSSTIHGHREIAQRSHDNLPLTNKSARPHHESPLHNLMTPPGQTRMVKSEHNSPHLGPTIMSNHDLANDFSIPAFNPNEYSYSPFGSNNSPAPTNVAQPDHNLPEQFPDSWFMSYEQAHDYEPPPVDWSQYNFDSSENLPASFNNNALGVANQPQSFTSFEQFGRLNPAFNTSSADVSEAGDIPANRPGLPRSTSRDASHDSPVPDDTSDRYRLSSASSYMGTPQVNLLASDNLANLDIDDYLRQAEVETRKMQMQNQRVQMQQIQQPQIPFSQGSPAQGQRTSTVSATSSAINSPMPALAREHPYTVHEAQQIAHMNNTTNSLQQKYETTPSSMADDPAWSVAPSMADPAMILDDEQEDEDWVR